jgi:hypothetical protein
MPEVTVATASATGARHRHNGGGNEDAVHWGTTADGAMLAVADGHSDPRCIRADRGARFAVLAAVELPDPQAPTAAEDLVAAWRRRVEADVRSDPLPPGVDPGLLPYGTTAIVCWIGGGGFRLLQIGDGVAMVATASGAMRPLPPGAGEGTGATDSLASPAAASTARSVAMPLTGLPAVVCLSTDGVDTAYPDGHGLPRAVEQLRTLAVEHGVAAMAARLDAWVRDAAATSGDDATVAVAFVTEDDARGAAR